jgi:TRAP-type C4-dicarboxylate transport system permease large subunit
MARDVSLSQTYRAVLPFVASDIARTVILVIFPPITLALVWLFS